jgi:hypothetical protein
MARPKKLTNKQAVASLDPFWQIYIAELALQLVPLVS